MGTITFTDKAGDKMDVDFEVTSDDRLLLVFQNGEEEDDFLTLFDTFAEMGRSAIFKGMPALDISALKPVILSMFEEDN